MLNLGHNIYIYMQTLPTGPFLCCLVHVLCFLYLLHLCKVYCSHTGNRTRAAGMKGWNPNYYIIWDYTCPCVQSGSEYRNCAGVRLTVQLSVLNILLITVIHLKYSKHDWFWRPIPSTKRIIHEKHSNMEAFHDGPNVTSHTFTLYMSSMYL